MPWTQRAVRTRTWWESKSEGGRVCAVALVDSRERHLPMISASRTIIQPVGVIQVVSTMFVPGS